MLDHFSYSDHAFKEAIDSCTLVPKLFSHEAHLRFAWLMIKDHGPEKAVDEVCDQIFKFVDNIGATDKFHKTLTVAAVKVVNHFMEKSSGENF